MAKNRELSQVGGLVTVHDSTGQVGIANSVGINTTAPTGSFALDVHGTANISGTLNISGGSAATQGDATALAIALG